MTTKPLPDWAIEPLDMAGAARVLGVCKRTLTDMLKAHPHYEVRGRHKKVFYPAHIELLRRAKWDLSPSLPKLESGKLQAPLQVNALEKALRAHFKKS
jgi:hypothetical protein